MKPKHCVSNRAYCNQTAEHQIHYTDSEQFGTVLNYRIIAFGYVK
jgi:2-hydroxy-3-keto-5-methylthiopentenyl-1-phosphate phosphatase